MLQPSTLDFLKKLKKNNNKEWFDKNKGIYEEAKKDFEALVGKLLPAIAAFDPAISELKPKDCIFRIYRDVRFSKDKTPYKSHFGANMARGGRKSHGPGYYIHIEPGRSFLAGGIWMPPAPELNAIRQEIDYNFDEFQKITREKSFIKYFDKLDESEKLKTLPKGYEKDNPAIEVLKLKSFTVTHEIEDKTILSKDLLKHCGNVYKTMLPLNNFIARSFD